MKELGYAVYCIYVITIIWLLISSLIQIHLLCQLKKRKKTIIKTLPQQLPFVSIQVPVYNEKYVIEELLQSLSELDYPKELFEIQVLDDSTDETTNIIKNKSETISKKGINISIINRINRAGYKAGALAYGLSLCKGELVAIFDADFRPPKNFLKSLVPHFNDDKVGLAQARWGHLNKEQNFLTRIQTFLLDTHFNIEQAGRHNAGYFMNFCGTAGIWRKQCITNAGGWDSNVLSEDLDLSYRAQLKGWKVLYDQDIVVPAELPSVIEAFKIQQFRWTKGIAQTARKTLKQIWQHSLPLDKKLHSVFHLLSSFVFLCLFINALLTVPLMILRNIYNEFITLSNYTMIGGLNLVFLTILYYNGTKAAQSKETKFFIHYPVFIVVYLSLCVQNAIAVAQGLIGMKSGFVRTPKFSLQKANNTSYLNKSFNWINILEIALFLYFVSGIILSIYFGDYFFVMFFLMMAWGLGILIYQTLIANWKPFYKKKLPNF